MIDGPPQMADGQVSRAVTGATYAPTDKEISDIDKNFVYHAPKGTQSDRYVYLRNAAKMLAMDFLSDCPPSRERSLALTKLEEAAMWANAAIARNE